MFLEKPAKFWFKIHVKQSFSRVMQIKNEFQVRNNFEFDWNTSFPLVDQICRQAYVLYILAAEGKVF